MTTVLKGFVLRLYPTEEQITQIRKTTGCVRWIQNQVIEMNATRKKIDPSARFAYGQNLNYLLPTLKTEYPWLKEVDSTALQGAMETVSNTYDRYCHGLCRKPKFRKKDAYKQSFLSKCVSGNVRVIDKHHIRIPKLGNVYFKAGKLPNGRIKSVTVTMKASGKYEASVLCEYNEEDLPKTGRTVGIDLGLKDLAILSDGTKYALPRWDKESEDQLHYWQRLAARRLLRAKEAMKKGKTLKLSDFRNYQKARQMYAKIQEHIARQRKDYLSKITTEIVQSYDVIVIEDLKESRMTHNHKLARAIANAGWYAFGQMLAYKCAFYGKTLIRINPAYTSQICSECGVSNGRLGLNAYGWLKVREWDCPVCGAHHDRDINAAQNILNIGLSAA